MGDRMVGIVDLPIVGMSKEDVMFTLHKAGNVVVFLPEKLMYVTANMGRITVSDKEALKRVYLAFGKMGWCKKGEK